MSVDIYQHISYHPEKKKKEETNLLTMKIHQIPNRWQHVTWIKLAKQYSNT